MEGIMEGKEWIWDNGVIKESKSQEFIDLHPQTNRQKTFESFLSKL